MIDTVKTFLASSEFDLLITLMTVLGGLGIFLYGINLMGDSLKAAAGNKLKILIEKSTNTPIKGVLVGALVTAIIQSSSGTTALAVGLVRAGLMTFPQAVGIIMGANIGTTITSFIVGLNIAEYCLWFVAIGAFISFFAKRERIKSLGNIIFGFGLLFFGLDLMGENLKVLLKANEGIVNDVFAWLGSNPLGYALGFFVGTIVTALVQSSSAVIGIIQKLYAGGSIGLWGAVPILLGCNVGTTITAIFACLGGGTQAKRTALIHTMFNVVGSLLFMAFIWAFVPFVEWAEATLLTSIGASGEMTIAFAHIVFNLVTTFILFFFIKQMVAFATKVIKDRETKEDNIPDELLDYTLINKSPVLALSFIKKAIEYMTKNAIRYIEITHEYISNGSLELYAETEKIEDLLDTLDKRIHDYLIRLMITDLDKKTSALLSSYLNQIKDLERIGDHCNNIMDFFKSRHEENISLTKEGVQDLEQIFSVLLEMSSHAYNAIINWSKEEADIARSYEDEIDKLHEVFYKRHIHRIDVGVCSVASSEHYVETLSNIERLGDHLDNICENVKVKIN